MDKAKNIIVALICFIISMVCLTTDASTAQKDVGLDQERDMMVKDQIEARGIKDKRVLDAMRKVKRHLFVPLMYRPFAYADSPLPIGEGQTISQPYIVALMTELLELKPDEKVLEIGTGSGYQAAILAELCKEVYTIEIFESLAERSRNLLKKLGYKNIHVRCADGYLGWLQHAPFDAIIVTCAPEEVPGPLIDQLAEGGRLVIPVGSAWQELKLLKKIDGKIVTTNVIPVRFVPMLRERHSSASLISNEAKPPWDAKEISENLRRHTVVLSKDIGERNFIEYKNLERAADYIKKEFENYGYLPQEYIYNLEGKPYRNIIAQKKGKSFADKIIIVCAHYDSVIGSPGADDNASAVAALLELARILYNEDLNMTLKFVAFVNEEPPFFTTKDMGSFRYAQEAKKKKENIKGVLCLESIGYYSDKKGSQGYPPGFGFFYPNRGNFIAMVSNFESRRLLKTTVREFKKASGLPVEYLVGFSILAPAISFSDHWSFWRFGYKAIMITDTAFYRNPYYHTPADTFDKLDYQRICEVVKGLCHAIIELAK